MDPEQRWQIAADVAWQATNDSRVKINRCVLQTRILLELHRTGHPIAAGSPMRAQAVAAIAVNDVMLAHVSAGGAPGDEVDGGWSVGVDPRIPAEGRDYGAHLILVGQGVLVDGSAPQLDRPARNIHVPRPLVTALPEQWDAGEPGHVRLDGGGMVAWIPVDNPPGWQHAPDWRKPAGWLMRPIAEKINELIRRHDLP